MRLPFAFAILLLLAGATEPAFAQTTWNNQLAVTGGAQFPAGSFDMNWKTGRGFAFTYYHRPSSRLFVGIRSGYHRFEARAEDTTLGIIPILLAAKYNLALSGLQPYLGLDGGLYLPRRDERENNARFGVAPRIGLRIPVIAGLDVDLNATYELLLTGPDNRTYVGLNAGIAYIFGS